MLEKIIAGCLIGITLSLGSCSTKEDCKETITTLESKDPNKKISTMLVESDDFSTPNTALARYIELYKRKNYDKLLKHYRFNNEKIEEILKYINPEEEKRYDKYLIKNNIMSYKEIEESNNRRIKYSLDIVDILKNEPEENINKYFIYIINTQYCIIRNEEVALVRTILTDKQTNKKEEIYCRLANNFGKWLLVDQFKPPLPRFIKTYSISTIKDNIHKSEIIENLKKRILKRLKNKKYIQNEMKHKRLDK